MLKPVYSLKLHFLNFRPKNWKWQFLTKSKLSQDWVSQLQIQTFSLCKRYIFLFCPARTALKLQYSKWLFDVCILHLDLIFLFCLSLRKKRGRNASYVSRKNEKCIGWFPQFLHQTSTIKSVIHSKPKKGRARRVQVYIYVSHREYCSSNPTYIGLTFIPYVFHSSILQLLDHKRQRNCNSIVSAYTSEKCIALQKYILTRLLCNRNAW